METNGTNGTKLFAVPYRWDQGAPEKNQLILDRLVQHPLWWSCALTPEEIRESAAWGLTHPEHHIWEVWLGGRLVGMLLISDITPKVDALLHFTFFGISLFAARRLLWNFLGYAFEVFQLQRITFEAPEHVRGLVGFMRQKLYFRYEGESQCAPHPITQHLLSHAAGAVHAADAPTWIARQGSRRERAHWDGHQWRDIVILRLLKSEYDEQQHTQAATLGAEPEATRDESPSRDEASAHVAQGEAREV